jgi:hypothetical protein
MYVEASNPGWPMPLATFFDAAGLMHTFNSKTASIIFMIVSNVLLLEAVLRQIKREGQKSFLSVCFVNCLLLYLVFCVWYFRPNEASSYNPYKAAVSMSYISFILIMRFLDGHLNSPPARPGKIGKYAAAAVFAVFFLLSLLGSYNYVSGIVSDMKNPRTDVPDAMPLLLTVAHEELRAAGADPRNEGANFYVNCDSRFNHLIAGYYLPFGRAYNLGKNGGGYGDRPAKETAPFKEGDILVSSTNFPEIYSDENMPELFSNKIYTLSSVREDSILLYDFDGLGRRVFKINPDTQGEPVTAREIMTSSAAMHFMTTRERTVDFTCAFYVPGEEIREKMTAALYVNGLYAGALNTGAAYAVSTVRGLRLKKGINELKISIGGMSFEIKDDRFLLTPDPGDDDYAALAGVAFK